MLVLKRYVEDDTILMIGDQQIASIKVVEIHGNSVRLGFDCPNDVRIIRPKVVKENEE
jgi:carbon storage regulator CsrA